MKEFQNRPSEAIDSEEVERTVLLADSALPNLQPDVQSRVREWDIVGTDTYGKSLLVERSNNDERTYLIGLKVILAPEDQDTDIVMYVLTPELCEFITLRGNDELFKSLGAYGEDEVSKDFQNLLFEMGDFHPLENDWNDFVQLIEEAGRQADRQKEKLARLLAGTAESADRHISVMWVDKKIDT